VAAQVQGEQISGDAHARDMWPLECSADGDSSIVKEALFP
jgi:hypothetical protein